MNEWANKEIDWLIDRLIGWLHGWLTEWMTEWMNELMKVNKVQQVKTKSQSEMNEQSESMNEQLPVQTTGERNNK